MKIPKNRIMISAIIFALALGLVGTASYGLISRQRPATFATLDKMRSYSVMAAAHQPLIDQISKTASDAAYVHAKENNFSRNQRAAYAGEKTAEARLEATETLSKSFSLDSPAYLAAILSLDQKLIEAYEALDLEQQVFLNAQSNTASVEIDAEIIDTAPVVLDEEGTLLAEPVTEDAMRPLISDLTGFVPSAGVKTKLSEIEPYMDALLQEIENLNPILSQELMSSAREQIRGAVRSQGDTFQDIYDRSAAVGATGLLTKSDANRMQLVRNAENMFYIGFGILVLGISVLFYKQAKAKLGMPRFVILLFFVLLIVLSGLYNIAVPGMITNILQRLGMYGVLVLAMLPGIQSGISLNLGMPIGIISGLMATLIAMENNMTGWPAFGFAVFLAIILALPVGYFYGKLLNRLKGNEMTVSTYVGFSYVSLFCIAWMVLPFKNPKLTWALGTGLRTMHNMGNSFGSLLDNFLRFKVLGVSVPTGLLLFLFLCCLLMFLFERSKSGVAMLAAGSNPAFATASGINVDKMRIVGTTLSTVIASVGIIVYSSSFGFMQLYNGPQQMGFIAASAILIGGATVSKAKVYHVLLGTFLFQGVLAMGIQVANAMIDIGGLSEVMRILISNGIILYALTQAGGNGRD